MSPARPNRGVRIAGAVLVVAIGIFLYAKLPLARPFVFGALLLGVLTGFVLWVRGR